MKAATTQRFVLLIGLFLVSSLFMMSTVWAAIAQPKDMAESCAIGAGQTPGASSAQNYLVTNTPAFYSCLTRFNDLGRVFGPGYYLIVTAPLVLAVLVYLLQPVWKRRFTRAVWAAESRFPSGLAAELRGLAEASGLEPGRRLSYVVDATSSRANAVVFGRPGRYTMVLEGGMYTQLRQNPAAFRATVLHEFAHIRNRDVDIAYLTLAVWRVFLVAVLIPFVAVNIWWLVQAVMSSGGPLDTLSGTWLDLLRGLVLAGFIVCFMYLAMADTLRTREICADLKAVDLGADRGCWTGHVPEPSAEVPEASRVRDLIRAAKSLLKTHPGWAVRVQALDDSQVLSTVRALPMFLAGAAIDMLLFEFSFNPASQGALASSNSSGLGHLLFYDAPSVYPATVLATAVVGVLVWREVVFRARAGLPVPSGLRAGFWFGVGHLAGELLVGQVLSRWVLESPRVLMLALPVLAPMAVLWWTAGCARLWSDLPARRRRVAAVATLAVYALALSWWYETWLLLTVVFLMGYVISTSTILGSYYAAGLAHSTSLKVVATMSMPVTGIAGGVDIWVTMGLWLIPLAGTLRRGRWPTRSAFIGLAVGAVAAAVILIITARMHASIWAAALSVYEAGLTVISGWQFAVMLAGVCLAAVLAAVAGTGKGREKGQATGAVIAAYCAMISGLVVLFAFTYTDGCVRPLALVYNRCSVQTGTGWTLISQFLPWLIGLAGLVSLGVAVPAAAITRLAKRSRAGKPEAQMPEVQQPKRRHPVRLAGLAVTAAFLLTVSAVSFVKNESGRLAYTGKLSTSALPQPGQSTYTKVWNWFYFGGQNLMAHYEYDLGDADGSVAPDGHVNITAMKKACAALGAVASQAQLYPPIPVVSLQKPWAATLAATGPETRRCVDALDRQNAKELDSALEALNRRDALPAIFARIKAVAKLK